MRYTLQFEMNSIDIAKLLNHLTGLGYSKAFSLNIMRCENKPDDFVIAQVTDLDVSTLVKVTIAIGQSPFSTWQHTTLNRSNDVT